MGEAGGGTQLNRRVCSAARREERQRGTVHTASVGVIDERGKQHARHTQADAAGGHGAAAAHTRHGGRAARARCQMQTLREPPERSAVWLGGVLQTCPILPGSGTRSTFRLFSVLKWSDMMGGVC